MEMERNPVDPQPALSFEVNRAPADIPRNDSRFWQLRHKLTTRTRVKVPLFSEARIRPAGQRTVITQRADLA